MAMAENTKLVEYIKASRLSGRTDREIRKTLNDIGWTDGPLNQAFQQVDAQSYVVPSASSYEPRTVNNSVSYDEGSGRGRMFLLLAIVGLLIVFATAALVINFRPSTFSGTNPQNSANRDKQRESDIKSYADALGKYLKDHNRYSAVSGPGLDSTDGGVPGVFDQGGSLKPYLSSFPTDLKNGQSLCQVNASTTAIRCAYKYRVSADGKTFILWAILENTYNNDGVYTTDSLGRHTLIGSEPRSAP
jgi:hypothetical protein